MHGTYPLWQSCVRSHGNGVPWFALSLRLGQEQPRWPISGPGRPGAWPLPSPRTITLYLRTILEGAREPHHCPFNQASHGRAVAAYENQGCSIRWRECHPTQDQSIYTSTLIRNTHLIGLLLSRIQWRQLISPQPWNAITVAVCGNALTLQHVNDIHDQHVNHTFLEGVLCLYVCCAVQQ